MTLKTTWSIENLKRQLSDGYVEVVAYRVDGEDGTYKYGAYGDVNLDKPDTLVPYADLTEETVIGWVKAKLDADNAGSVDRIETAIKDGVNEQKTPTTGTGKPW